MQKIIVRLLLLVVTPLWVACSNKIKVIDKSVVRELPGIQNGLIMANYKVSLIAKTSSEKLKFNSASIHESNTPVKLFSIKGGEINIFEKGDTIVLRVSFIENDVSVSDYTKQEVIFSYSLNKKAKKINIDNFKILQLPINQ